MRQVKIINKPLDWFTDNPDNYRAHPADQQAVLQRSLRKFGVVKNVVARPDGTILCGHGIIAAAKAEGLADFPVVIFEGTDAEAKALLITDNEISTMAMDDDRALTNLLKDLQDIDPELLEVTGFDSMKLAALVLVTRREDEIPDFDAALHWTGMPEVEERQCKTGVELIVRFETEEQRQEFMERNQLRNLSTGAEKRSGATMSAWYPARPRDNPGSSRFADGDDE